MLFPNHALWWYRFQFSVIRSRLYYSIVWNTAAVQVLSRKKSEDYYASCQSSSNLWYFEPEETEHSTLVQHHVRTWTAYVTCINLVRGTIDISTISIDYLVTNGQSPVPYTWSQSSHALLCGINWTRPSRHAERLVPWWERKEILPSMSWKTVCPTREVISFVNK